MKTVLSLIVNNMSCQQAATLITKATCFSVVPVKSDNSIRVSRLPMTYANALCIVNRVGQELEIDLTHVNPNS